MSNNEIDKPLLRKRYLRYIEFTFSSAATVGLAILIVWALVSNSDPKAAITDIHQANGNLTVSIRVTNPNYFRGFNYTSAYLFFIDKNMSRFYRYDDIVMEQAKVTNHSYVSQGIRQPLAWDYSFPMANSFWRGIWEDDQEIEFYAALNVVFTYKILFWSTSTTYNQWLEVYFNLTENINSMNAVFNRMTDFSFVMKNILLPG